MKGLTEDQLCAEVVRLNRKPDRPVRSAEYFFGPRLDVHEAAHRRSKHNKTGYRGVGYNSQHNPKLPYTARIQYKRRMHAIGCYATAEEAARAYDEWAKKIFGDVALTNF